MTVIVEVQVVDVKKGESVLIPEHLVIGKVGQRKNSKRLYLYPSPERLRRLIMTQILSSSNRVIK